MERFNRQEGGEPYPDRIIAAESAERRYSVQECNRAGGILGILNELNKGGLINGTVKRVDGKTLDEQMKKYDITGTEIDAEADRIYHSAPGRKFSTQMGSQNAQWESLDTDRAEGCIRDLEHAYTKDGGLAVLFGNIAQNGCVVKTAGVDPGPPALATAPVACTSPSTARPRTLQARTL